MNDEDSITIFLEKADEYISTGIQNEQQDKYDTARQYYLMASKAILKAAKKSPEKLKKRRKEKAEKLFKRAQSLPSAIREKNDSKADEDRERTFQPIEVTDVSFDDVVGLQDVKEYIQNKLIKPMEHREKAKTFGVYQKGGLILFGPPGTGKTYLSKAIANETNSTFYAVKSSDIMSRWVGKAEKNVDQLFSQAKATAPSILFIDEIDALLRKRSATSSSVVPRVVDQFLAEMDGIEDRSDSIEGVFFIGATNEPWELDDAMRTGRIDMKVYVPPPDYEARKKIFQFNLKQYPVSDDIRWEKLAQLTEGYVGSDIKAICETARLKAFEENVQGKRDEVIYMKDITDAISRISPSVTEDRVKKFEQFNESLGITRGG